MFQICQLRMSSLVISRRHVHCNCLLETTISGASTAQTPSAVIACKAVQKSSGEPVHARPVHNPGQLETCNEPVMVCSGRTNPSAHAAHMCLAPLLIIARPCQAKRPAMGKTLDDRNGR